MHPNEHCNCRYADVGCDRMEQVMDQISGREEHAFLLSLAALILVLSWIVPYIFDLFSTIQTLFSL